MISFGTDGWRAIIADQFTFGNVAIVAQALADYSVQENPERKPFVVGYDNRFMSEDFAKTTAEVLAANGFPVLLCKQAVPTPVVSHAVMNRSAFAGVMITASHNPYNYNGFKIKMACGASASPEMTKSVESYLYKTPPRQTEETPGHIEVYDPKPEYVAYIREKISPDPSRYEGLSIVVDDMYGSGIGYLTDILRDIPVTVTEIRSHRDPLFGGINPEPLAYNTPELLAMMQEKKAWGIGIVLDGDADRLGIVDSGGRFMSSHEAFILLLHYLFTYRNIRGPVAKAFNMTRMLDHLSELYEFELIETKIGFKYLAPYLIGDKVVLAGEESGGFGTTLHLPERDGIFNALLILDLLARSGKAPEDLIDEIQQKTGYYFYDRIDVPIASNEKKDRIMEALEDAGPDSFGSTKVTGKRIFDGVKFLLENDGWVLFRKSGTESLLRVYAEGRSPDNLQGILQTGRSFIESFR